VADGFCDFIAGRGQGDVPFFAQVGLFEPHRPFPHPDVDPLPREELTVPGYLPDIPEVREDLADLEASVCSADRAVGRMVDALRSSTVGEDTILVFTADHGIAFPHSKMTLYDPGIEVPLIVSMPGVSGGVVREEMISNVDVMPTLLELLGLPVPGNLHGRSFCTLITGGDYGRRDAVFAEKTYHAYYDPMRAIRTERWKLIANFEAAPWMEIAPDFRNNAKGHPAMALAMEPPREKLFHPPFEFFDLEADPFEQNDLAGDPAFAETRDALARRLREWMQTTGDPLLHGPMAQRAYIERMQAFLQL
jgi:arylsulfatase A-like enzyme